MSKANSEWAKIKPSEVEKLVVDLAKEGNSAEKIGLILRDQHGIPKTKLFGKKIGQILKENNIEANAEMTNIEEKVDTLKSHFKDNKHDYAAQRAITKYSSRIRHMQKNSA